MKPWRKRLLNFLLVSLLFLPAPKLVAQETQGPVIEEWQTSNTALKIRITVREDTNKYMNGAYYQFESAPVESKEWRQFMVFRQEGHPPIPKQQINFVNDHIAYAFIGWMYALTQDGGVTWSVWDAKAELPDWSCCNYDLIRQVKVFPNGEGEMVLNPVSGRAGEMEGHFLTTNYGRSWKMTPR